MKLVIVLMLAKGASNFLAEVLRYLFVASKEVVSVDACYPVGASISCSVQVMDGTDIFLDCVMNFDRVKCYVTICQSDLGDGLSVLAEDSTKKSFVFLIAKEFHIPLSIVAYYHPIL